MYRLYVGTEEDNTMWNKFIKECLPAFDCNTRPTITEIDKTLLEKFNAINEHDSLYIRFADEKDAIVFKLKFR